MKAAQLRPACTLPAAQGSAHSQPAPQSAPQWTRRQLQGALAAAMLLGPQRAAAAAAEAGGRRQEMQQIEQAYDSYAGEDLCGSPPHGQQGDSLAARLWTIPPLPLPPPLCPATYDSLDGGAAAESLGFPALRQQLLAAARGDVLETAVGTGLNLPLYDSAALTSLTAIDLSSGMLAQARQRAERLGLSERTRLQLVQADVEQLQAALGGRQFDTGASRLQGRGVAALSTGWAPPGVASAPAVRAPLLGGTPPTALPPLLPPPPSQW